MEAIEKLVLKFRLLLKTRGKSSFRGKELMNFIEARPELKQSIHELVAIIKTHFANPRSTNTLILPLKNRQYEFEGNAKKFVFLDAYLVDLSQNPKILNLRSLRDYFSDDLPVFYLPEARKHEMLDRPIEILKQLRSLIDKYLSMVRQNPQGSIHKTFSNKNDPTLEQINQLAHLLPFINIKILASNPDAKKAYMSQLSVVFKFHVLVDQGLDPAGCLDSYNTKTGKDFKKYMYNVAGACLSLKNIVELSSESRSQRDVTPLQSSCLGFLFTSSKDKNVNLSKDINKRFHD